MLRTEGGSFAFRHELARQAVLQAMAPTRAIGLHRLVLQVLLGSDEGRRALGPRTRAPVPLLRSTSVS